MTHCPVDVPAAGTAYRVLIERVLNHEIGKDEQVSGGVVVHREVTITDLHGPIHHGIPEPELVKARTDSLLELAKNTAKAEQQLTATFDKKVPPGSPAGTPAPVYGGVTVPPPQPFDEIHKTMDALVNNGLDDAMVVLYHGMRAFIGKVEDYISKVGYKDGWDAHVADPGGDRDAKALAYKVDNTKNALVHDTY